MKEFVETGKLRFVVLDFPLESIHPKALKAAEATHCAQDQGKFWEMHDRLFEQQKDLDNWKAHAEALGLDVAKFDECLSSGKHTAAIRKEIGEAAKAGATGTPSYVLAVTDPANPSKAKGLTFIKGAQPYERFKTEIEKGLADLGAPGGGAAAGGK